MRYSQVNRKLEHLYEKLKRNDSELKNRNNEDLILGFFQNINSPIITLYESDWQIATPEQNDLKTINKNDLLAESLSINFTSDISFPKQFLPFINLKVLLKSPPDSQISVYKEVTTENLSGDYIHIKGDGSTIYKGIFPLPSNQLVSQEFIDNNQVPEANTKKVWRVTISYTDAFSGDENVVSGELYGVSTQENERTCIDDVTEVETTITDDFGSFPFISATKHYNKITDFSSTGFTALGFTTEREFDNQEDCAINETITDGITATKSFSSVDDYVLIINGVNDNLTQNTSSSGNFNITGSNITSFDSIVFQGYRPYYSSLTQRIITVINAGDLVLSNLPDTATAFDESLPYSNITLSRNPDGFPETTETNTILFTQSSVGNLAFGNAIKKELSFFKIADDFYKLRAKIGATYLAPATEPDPNPTHETQEDTYTVSGTTYGLSSSDSGVKSNAFVTKKQDVEYKIIMTVKNPFYFKEIRQYDTQQ